MASNTDDISEKAIDNSIKEEIEDNIGKDICKEELDNSNINAKEVEDGNEDPFAYLGRDFSSENYKIEVKNMPKFYGMFASIY